MSVQLSMVKGSHIGFIKTPSSKDECNILTVVLSCFGKIKIEILKLLIQPPHHLVTCGNNDCTFSFF